jgi:hypothetical protein
LYEQCLSAATTGRSSDPAQKPGTIQQILGNQDYENLKFDRSGDGKDLAVGRAKRGTAEDIGLWVPRPEIFPIPQGLLSRAAREFA